MYTDWEGKNKTVFVHRWHDHPQRKSKRLDKRRLELISNYSKVAGYKVNINKSVAFLCTGNEQLELEHKNSTPFTLTKKSNTWA